MEHGNLRARVDGIILLPLQETAAGPHRKGTLTRTVKEEYFLTYYSVGVILLVAAWILYLWLPRGIQKAYFGAHRRRRRRARQQVRRVIQPNTNNQNHANTSKNNTNNVPRSKSTEVKRQQLLSSYRAARDDAPRQAPSTRQVELADDVVDHPTSWKPHPALTADVVDASLLVTTWQRLRKGLKFVAHGVQAPSQPVWLRMDSKLYWSKATNRWKTYTLDNVLWIHVGANTVESAMAFSIQTAQGSLDLTAQSVLERNAVVTCLAHWLDLRKNDWRKYCDDESSMVSQISSANFGLI